MTIGDNFADDRPFWSIPYSGQFNGGPAKMLPRPKPGIWPPPVYEAHYSDGSTLRYSFWSPKGKPLEQRSIHERMAARGDMTKGFIEHNGERWECDDWNSRRAPIVAPPKRITAKQARESLGRLLACLDGSVTDHSQIRAAVVAARAIAA